MDGCAYVSGSFDGKDVTKPWKVNPENARDHFKSGLYPSTGGGARLGEYYVSKLKMVEIKQRAVR